VRRHRSRGQGPALGDGVERAPADRLLLAGLGVAYTAFGLTFRGPRRAFWNRMTATGLALGSLALATEPRLRRARIRRGDVVAGVASAAGLYGIFLLGDRMVRRLIPGGGEQIGDVYALRQLGPAPELAARLALVIGPAEELFWRGFVNPRLQRRLGRWPGAAAGSFAYAGAHVATGNFTLFGAAGVAGAYWSALEAASMPMGALVVSHVAWDLVTFLVAPTTPDAPAAPAATPEALTVTPEAPATTTEAPAAPPTESERATR
jgi:membrane protease YdiL (CAAX protease family)